MVRGPEAIKISVVLSRLAFPAFRVVVVDLVAEQQTVALRWAAHGTPLPAGPPPADALHGMTFTRMVAGQIVESWTCWESSPATNAHLGRDIRA